jgi:hypothetical protein
LGSIENSIRKQLNGKWGHRKCEIDGENADGDGDDLGEAHVGILAKTKCFKKLNSKFNIPKMVADSRSNR